MMCVYWVGCKCISVYYSQRFLKALVGSVFPHQMRNGIRWPLRSLIADSWGSTSQARGVGAQGLLLSIQCIIFFKAVWLWLDDLEVISLSFN